MLYANISFKGGVMESFNVLQELPLHTDKMLVLCGSLTKLLEAPLKICKFLDLIHKLIMAARYSADVHGRKN